MATLNKRMMDALLVEYVKDNDSDFLDFQDTKAFVKIPSVDDTCPKELIPDATEESDDISFKDRWDTRIIGDENFVHVGNDLKHEGIEKFNGNYLDVPKETFELWMKVLEVDEVFTYRELGEKARVLNMTPEDYRVEKLKELELKKKPSFVEFSAYVKDKELTFSFDVEDKLNFIAQFSSLKEGEINGMFIHDKDMINEDLYNVKEAKLVMDAMTLHVLGVDLPIDRYKKRLLALGNSFTKEDVDSALNSQLNESELVYMNTKIEEMIN